MTNVILQSQTRPNQIEAQKKTSHASRYFIACVCVCVHTFNHLFCGETVFILSNWHLYEGIIIKFLYVFSLSSVLFVCWFVEVACQRVKIQLGMQLK